MGAGQKSRFPVEGGKVGPKGHPSDLGVPVATQVETIVWNDGLHITYEFEELESDLFRWRILAIEADLFGPHAQMTTAQLNDVVYELASSEELARKIRNRVCKVLTRKNGHGRLATTDHPTIAKWHPAGGGRQDT